MSACQGESTPGEVKVKLKSICEALIKRNGYEGAPRDFFIQYTRFVQDEEDPNKWSMASFEFCDDPLYDTRDIEYAEKDTCIRIRLHENEGSRLWQPGDYSRLRE